MGNPSAPIATLDALGTRLATLLAAADHRTIADAGVENVLAPEDRTFWDALAPETARDVGVFVATMDVTADALVTRMQMLIDIGIADKQSSSRGIVRLAGATFHGLKVAKRWDVLQLASLALVDIVAEAIQHRLEDDDSDGVLLLMDFYGAILLGFQHSGELMARAQVQIATLAPLIAAVGHEALTQRFLVAAAALTHCHRAYEAECTAIRTSLVDAFSAALAHRPIAECEAALRDATWILPATALNNYLPTIEGKWVQDEFSSEQHAAVATTPQNAGSITFKKAVNVLAYNVRATINDTRTKTQMQLHGALFRPLQNPSRAETGTNWQLEGHWSQIVEPAATSGTVQLVTPVIQAEPWTCGACTLTNEGRATKCATCGTDAPKNTSSQTTPAGAKTTNPAPFQAAFDADHTFMRVRWSRGEQSGVWLAKKETQSVQFDLGESLREASATAMVDSNAIPAFAYSPRGESSRVILLEKTYSLSTYGELALELWMQVEGASSELTKQTILATGEFELFVQQPSGSLVLNIGSGLHVVTTSASFVDDQFHHVALLFGKRLFQIVVDGIVAGELDRGMSDQARIPSRRSSWVSVGGNISDDGQQMESCFHGAILDLRIWSDLNARSLYSPVEALGGIESGLIGYFPLVGNSHRILQDVSKHDNHATVFGVTTTDGGGSTDYPTNGLLVAPFAAVGKIPITQYFTSAIGDFEISGQAAHCDAQGGSALRLGHPSAIWHNARVSIADGFRSVITLDSAKLLPSHASRLVFAMCKASFWDAPTLIADASSLGLSYDAEISENRYRDSSLFVVLERTAAENTPTDTASVAVYIYKNRQPLQLCRTSGLPLGSDVRTGLAVSYTRPAHVMTIEVLGSGATVEVGVDIETALDLQSLLRVRTGIILTSPMLHSNLSTTPLVYTSDVTKWTFETIDHQEHGVSALHQIYPRLKQGSPTDTDSGSHGASEHDVPTISCTRTSSDGSAMEQATYGCQTCGVVHGAGLCTVCALTCHDGHELVYMGSMITACACAMRGGSCKCVTPVPASEFPSVGQSVPRVAQWHCSRCTVVNAADVRECTVCANAAPSSSVLGRTPPASTGASAPESTSRALVPVPIVDTPPIQIPTEWSCPACTYLNTGEAAKCTICDSVRPSSDPPIEQPGRDGLVTLYNAAESQLHTESTPAVASPPTSPWYCEACTMENKPADNVCFMCQTVRAVPVADPVVPISIPVGEPVPTTEAVLVATAMETDADPVRLFEGNAIVDNAQRLARLQLDNALATDSVSIERNDLQKALADTAWDSTAGALSVTVEDRAFIAQYMEGEYAGNDGYVRGLAHLSSESSTPWTLRGRFKKVSQSQENAVSLSWDRGLTRFDGKWFRGDGSGEWKCVASPLANDFRGLGPVNPAKPSAGLQPFYSGLINMKQNLTNVCYQNSFLQSLFLTQAFRRLILSSKMDDYANLPVDMGSGSQGDVLRSIQDLFARLIASQRPELDSHVLQRCLPTTFQAGRQQDTSDFAHFLIDSLSQQLNQHHSTAHGIDNIFGGTQATIIACKVCGKKSINREYFWEMLLNMIDLRYTPITNISAVSGISSEISTPLGYERLNSNLNKDRNGVPYVYLCVKRIPEVSSTTTTTTDNFDGASSELPITDLVVKVVNFADAKPVLEGYERVELDLNIGGSTVVMGGKKQVYLFFRRELNGSPITDLQVIYGTESVPDGFKQIRVDLNQGEATKVFLCYRCDMPITDMKIVNTGIPGYRMVDHVLNRMNEDAVKQYLAFKVGGSDPCITDLKLIAATDAAAYLEQGWETLGSPSSTVEEGTTPDILAIRRGHGNPIFAVDVFRAPRQVPKYNDYEVIDVYGNRPLAPTDTTSPGAVATLLKGDWLADEAVDRARKAVRIHSISDAIPDGLVVKGSFDDKGDMTAIATTSSSSWSTVSAGDKSASTPSNRVLRVTGHWTSSKTKQAQLFDVELRPGAGDTSNVHTLSGTIGDGRGRPVAITGTQTSHHVRVKWPISDILVLRGDERVPEGVEVVRETCSGKTGNVLAQTQSPYTLYLAVKREETPSEGFVGDVCVIYGEIDAVPDNYTCVRATPSGHSANLNDGTTGLPIFICYRRVSAPTEKCLMDLALMWTSGAQADTLPTGFTKIQHTPLGMEANLNQGTTGVSIHLCFAKCDPADVVRPMDNPLNGEYEIVVAPGATSAASAAAPPPLIGKFIRLSVAERVEVVHTLEGKFGTVFHAYQPGMVRGTFYYSQQRRKQIVTGVWMSDEQNASSMIDFVPPSFPFEWSLNETSNELDGWWSTADDAASSSSSGATAATTPTAASGSASSKSTSASSTPTVRSWKLMKDAYVRIAFKKDYGTEWKQGELISSERVWRHDVASMLTRFVASRTLGGDNLLSCSQCERKTESRTHTVVVAPPAHLILTIKRMFYDWNQQKTRKSLHDVSFSPLLTLPALTSEDEEAFYADTAPTDSATTTRDRHRHRQYGLYGVLVHSGLTANSGHYFSYCRESDDSTHQLHQDDSALAPWIKFNDSRVERSSWAEINAAVSNSVSDTVYLLLYKRLSYTVPAPSSTSSSDAVSSVVEEEATAMDVDAEHTDDEDEAMLLAKAMALSMSAAQKKAQAEAEGDSEVEEAKNEEETPASEPVAFSGVVSPTAAEAVDRPMDRAVLREVEAANTQFLLDTMRRAASAVHVQDLHATLALQLGLLTNSAELPTHS